MDWKFDRIDDDFNTLSKRLADSKDGRSFAGALDEITVYLTEQKHALATRRDRTDFKSIHKTLSDFQN